MLIYMAGLEYRLYCYYSVTIVCLLLFEAKIIHYI